MRSGKRLFVGARVSIATANALAGCAETLARRARDAGVDLRWVAPTNYHVTLAFLGWTGVESIGAVCDALEMATVGESRAAFRTSRLGAFPSLDKANVLWAGINERSESRGRGPAGSAGGEGARPLEINDGAPLTRLAQSIGEAMAGLGFRRDTRPYHPHVTIARLPTSRAVRDVVLPLAEQMFGDTKIDGVTLFESETKSSGSVYNELEKITFKRTRNAPSESEKRQTTALERATEREPDETQTDDGWPRGQGPTE
jgi:2'-5' RNA ligase